MPRISTYTKDATIVDEDILLGSNYVRTYNGIKEYNTRSFKLEDLALYFNTKFTSASIDTNSITATELNISGNGSSGQFIMSDGDGSFSYLSILDEDNMSSNSATAPASQQSIKAYVDSQIATEDTIAELNDTTIGTLANAHLLIYDNDSSVWENKALSGDATITKDGVISLASSHTNIDSILNASLAVGRDADNQIKYSTDNQIIFRVDGGDNVVFKGSGEIEATSLDISGDIDIDGTTNLDAVDIDGAVQIDNTVTVGVDDTGYDVKFFGAASGKYMLWDESGNTLLFPDSTKITLGTGSDAEIYVDVGNDLYINSTTDDRFIYIQADDGSGGLAAYITIDGASERIRLDKETRFGVDDTGVDVYFYGATSGRNMQWRPASDGLDFSDNTKLNIGSSNDLQIYHSGSDSYIQNTTGSLVINASNGVSGTAIKDEDNMASDSASHLATQQSIKAYVDAQVDTEDTLAELDDTNISSAAAGQILVYDNTASVWDNVALTAGDLIDVTGGDGTLEIDVDLTEASEAAIANGDYMLFLDGGATGTPKKEALHDIATLFSGTGLTATNSVIAVDAAQTQITSVGTLNAGAISSGFGNIDNGSSTLNTGAATVDSLSVSDGNITNVGDIALDTISADGTTINVAMTDNTDGAFSVKQGSDKYIAIDTTDTGEDIAIGTGVSGTAITIGHTTSETTIQDNLTVTGNLKVNGDQVYQNVTSMAVSDPIISLQTGTDGANLGADSNKDVGLAMFWHNGSAAKTAFLGFDDSAGKLTFIPDASISSEVASGSVGIMVANLEGNVTGDLTGTVQTAAQTNITSLGTLTTLSVDNITINGNDISTTNSNGDLTISPNGTGNVNVYTDSLQVVGTEGEAARLALIADEADDSGDIWSIVSETGNTLTINSDKSGSAVAQMTLTPNATVASSTTVVAGRVFIGGGSGDWPTSTIGSSAGRSAIIGSDDPILLLHNTGSVAADTGSELWLTQKAASSSDTSDLTYTAGGVIKGYKDDANANALGYLRFDTTTTTGGTQEVLRLDSSKNATFAGSISATGTLTIGVNDTGHDVTFYGATSGKYMMWDESLDALFLPDDTKLLLGTGQDASIYVSSDDLYIDQSTTDKDIIFKGTDGGADITALTLDMSDGGAATFTGNINAGTGLRMYTDGSGNGVIYNLGQDKDLYLVGDDGGAGVNALVFDMSDGAAATFAGIVGINGSTTANVPLTATTSSGYEDVAYFKSAGTNINSRINLIPTGTGDGVVNSTANELILQTGGTNALKITDAQQVEFKGVGGADGYTLPYDQNPGYTNVSWGGGGVLFREAHDFYLTQNLYYYQTGGAQSWRYKYAAGAGILAMSGGGFTFSSVGSGSADAVASLVDKFSISQAGVVSISSDGSNATTLTESGSGDFTIDAVGDIYLDAGGDDIYFKDAGTTYAYLTHSGSDVMLTNTTADEDFRIRGNDGGSTINMLTFDTSEGGNAAFSGTVSHKGLDIADGDGTQIDTREIFDITIDFTANTWTDTGIYSNSGSYQLGSSGTYIMQIYSNDHDPNEPYWYGMYWSAIISWYKGATNQNITWPITLQAAGHADNSRTLEARLANATASAGGSPGENIRLELKTTANASSTNLSIRFRRLL